MTTNINYNYKIVAFAPTSYQLKGLRRFHLRHQKSFFGGSYISSENYFNIEDAQSHLVVIAEDYFENMNELNEAIDGIYQSNSLTIDGVTAKIIELCEAEQE